MSADRKFCPRCGLHFHWSQFHTNADGNIHSMKDGGLLEVKENCHKCRFDAVKPDITYRQHRHEASEDALFGFMLQSNSHPMTFKVG